MTENQSLPLRKCGLKLKLSNIYYRRKQSLPLRRCGLKSDGTWITASIDRHFPCGSVD